MSTLICMICCPPFQLHRYRFVKLDRTKRIISSNPTICNVQKIIYLLVINMHLSSVWDCVEISWGDNMEISICISYFVTEHLRQRWDFINPSVRCGCPHSSLKPTEIEISWPLYNRYTVSLFIDLIIRAFFFTLKWNPGSCNLYPWNYSYGHCTLLYQRHITFSIQEPQLATEWYSSSTSIDRW